jgi:hypothetical protein
VTIQTGPVRLVKRDTRAIEHVAPARTAQDGVCIKKSDDEEQIVFGEVYAPGFPDSQGDFSTAVEIKKMAYNFLRKGITSNIDVNHSQEQSGSYIAESFIAQKDDPIFIPGSWVIGVKVPDPVIWRMVKSGELNGFSLDGMGVRSETVFEFDMPDVLEGETTEMKGHVHRFFVKYDQDGNFLGGYTDPGPNGHVHQIERGTVTEDADLHNHRFSFVEGVLSAQVLH